MARGLVACGEGLMDLISVSGLAAPGGTLALARAVLALWRVDQLLEDDELQPSSNLLTPNL